MTMNTPSTSDDSFEASLRNLRPASLSADAELSLVRRLAFADGVRSVTFRPMSDQAGPLRAWKFTAFSAAAAAVLLAVSLIGVLVRPVATKPGMERSSAPMSNVRESEAGPQDAAPSAVVANAALRPATSMPTRRIRSDYLDALRIATRGGLDALRPVGGADTTNAPAIRSWPQTSDIVKGVLP